PRDEPLGLHSSEDLTLVDDRDDLALDRLADHGQLIGLYFEPQIGDNARVLPNKGRGPPVGEQAVGGFTLELEDVGEQFELLRDVSVARQRLGHRSDHKREAIAASRTLKARAKWA